MNSLHPLKDRNFLVEVDGQYYGKIPPEKQYKRCSAVIFQEFCPTTQLGYDVMISWLQKAIRRGIQQDAWYVAVHIAEMRGIFLSNLLNRLMVIVSEDIGPAEPTLAQRISPLYFKIKEERPKTGALREEEVISPGQKGALLTIVTALVNAKKSRITDWHIHKAEEGVTCLYHDEDDEDYDWQPFNELLEDFAKACQSGAKNSYERCSRAMEVVKQVLSIKEKLVWGTCQDPAKRRPIWLIWELLFQYCPQSSSLLISEMKALQTLYSARDDLLHLAHAVCLVIYQDQLPAITNPQSPDHSGHVVMNQWQGALQDRLPVLNDAIDRHTREGRNLLGRDLLFFLERGANLENHYPFPGELEMLQSWQNDERDKDENFAEKEPRAYQRPIIKATTEFFETESEGTLHMACGTGKTLTSFWIAHSLVDPFTATTFLIITPRLQVLGQFYRTYRDSFIQHGIKTVVGVICSDFSRPKPHDLCYHEHIRNQRELVAFWDRYLMRNDHGYQAVALFTTYRSLDKVRLLTSAALETSPPSAAPSGTKTKTVPVVKDPFWDLAIYDEGHHMNPLKHSLSARRKLLLSATPSPNQTVINRYDYKMAIDDGALVPYKLHVVPIREEIPDLTAVSKKLPMPPKGIDNLMPPPQKDVVSETQLIAHYILEGTFRKLIVFSLDNAQSKFLFDEFRSTYPEIPALYLDHKTKMKDRDPITREWSELTCGVFFNCSILGEGVDFPSVDAVYLESGHTSYTRVIQAAGRPLRLDPKRPDKVAHIIMSYRDGKTYDKMMRRLRYLTN